VAMEVGEIKGTVETAVKEGVGLDKVASELQYRYPANIQTIKRALAEVVDHAEAGYPVPTDKRVVLEDWEDNVIIHANFGSLANRTLARVVGHVISEDTGYPVGVQQDTYMIITQTVGSVDSQYVARLLRSLANSNMDQVIRDAVTKTGLFKKRLINVARKAGALSKFANFSNITLGRLMKSFEGTIIFEEAMKDTLRQDLDVDATSDLLRRMADGEIEVVVLETGGEVSPLGKLGVDSISMKTDIVPPEKMTRIILESAKARIYNETRILACLGKRDWLEERQAKEYPEKIVCPICGSTEVGVFDRSYEETAELQQTTKRSSREPPHWWTRGVDASKLVSMYGRRAAIVASAKYVDLTEAWDILAQTEGETDEFFERIVEAEREALRKRFM
jgi:ATP-dependent Lhr-like helicase